MTTEDTVIETARSMDHPQLSELVDRLVRDLGMSPKDAERSVYMLWSKGKIELEQTAPSTFTFWEYLTSPAAVWFWAVVAVVAVTIPVVFYAADPPLLYLRYALGSFFVLYIPGAMLIEALYSKAGELEGIVRVALSIGLSLAVVPLVGLVLNFTPWGITLVPVIFSLSALTMALGIVALYRKFTYYRLRLGLDKMSLIGQQRG